MSGDPSGAGPDSRKKVDESWKDAVQKEKDTTSGAGEIRRAPAPESPFSYFASTIALQAFAAMGEIPDPTGRPPDLDQSRYLIDTLGLLAEKTKGNLTPDEQAQLDGLLYELRTKFVQKTRPGGEAP